MAAVKYEPCPRCRSLGKDSSADNLVVWPDGGKFCFSCRYCDRSATNAFRWLKHDETIPEQAKAVLPNNFTREIPHYAWRWLLQYGLGYKYWQPHVGWSEKDSRLVFTVGNPIEFSIGRFIAKPDSGDTNKRKWFVWGNSHKTPHIFGDYRTSKEIVLVEDLISAHKVSQVSTCIPLFGVKVFDSVYPALRHIKLPIVIWLDKDQENTMPGKAHNLSLITGLPVRYVTTPEDPKSCSPQKISTVISG